MVGCMDFVLPASNPPSETEGPFRAHASVRPQPLSHCLAQWSADVSSGTFLEAFLVATGHCLFCNPNCQGPL